MLKIKQQEDIECSKYFIPENSKDILITEADEQKYLEWSEQGKHKEEANKAFSPNTKTGFDCLVMGKKSRGLHVEMYEQSVLEGSIPYYTILEDTPRSVVNFLKKEMFQGMDANVIENCYKHC